MTMDTLGEQLTRWSFLVRALHSALEAITTAEPAEARKQKALECLLELAEIGPLTGLPPGVQADIAQIRAWCEAPERADFTDLVYTVRLLHYLSLSHLVELGTRDG